MVRGEGRRGDVMCGDVERGKDVHRASRLCHYPNWHNATADGRCGHVMGGGRVIASCVDVVMGRGRWMQSKRQELRCQSNHFRRPYWVPSPSHSLRYSRTRPDIRTTPERQMDACKPLSALA